MLVLSRRLNQRIMINDNIVITVASIHQGSVSIGIDAPDDYIIHREEIYNKVNDQNIDKSKFNKKDKETDDLVNSIMSRIKNLLDGSSK